MCVVSKLLLDNGADPKATMRYLLHDAAEANHHSMEKVDLLIKHGLDASQENAAGLTLMHVAAGGKPPRLDLLQHALEEKSKVDPNKKDRKGDTALHKVTRNFAERTVPWKQSREAMELLLSQTDIDVNAKNAQGLTPLRLLVRLQGFSVVISF